MTIAESLDENEIFQRLDCITCMKTLTATQVTFLNELAMDNVTEYVEDFNSTLDFDICIMTPFEGLLSQDASLPATAKVELMLSDLMQTAVGSPLWRVIESHYNATFTALWNSK
jgi:hypothetical protein